MPEPPRRWPSSDRPSRARTIIGTIEVLAGTVVVLALIALAIWFFFFAHNPLLR
jgi:hypothetical protein